MATSFEMRLFLCCCPIQQEAINLLLGWFVATLLISRSRANLCGLWGEDREIIKLIFVQGTGVARSGFLKNHRSGDCLTLLINEFLCLFCGSADNYYPSLSHVTVDLSKPFHQIHLFFGKSHAGYYLLLHHHHWYFRKCTCRSCHLLFKHGRIGYLNYTIPTVISSLLHCLVPHWISFCPSRTNLEFICRGGREDFPCEFLDDLKVSNSDRSNR